MFFSKSEYRYINLSCVDAWLILYVVAVLQLFSWLSVSAACKTCVVGLYAVLFVRSNTNVFDDFFVICVFWHVWYENFTIVTQDFWVCERKKAILAKTTEKSFYYRAMLRRARLCHSMWSVRPSIRLSVRLSGTVITGWNTSKIISRPNSLRFMLGLTPTWAIWSNGNTTKIMVK